MSFSAVPWLFFHLNPLSSFWGALHCVFVESSDKTTTIMTKGESSKDAAGNTVKIRNQKAEEVKVLKEVSASISAATLKGLVVLSSEVTSDKSPEFVLIMGLSQKNIALAGAASDALKGKATGGSHPAKGSSGGSSSDDTPSPEQRVNPESKDFM